MVRRQRWRSDRAGRPATGVSDAREERSSAPKNWVDVVERLLELEGLVDADDREHENAVHAGLHTLIMEAYDDLEPIGDAPFEITGWEPDSDKQPEPDEPGGERTAPPAKMSTMVDTPAAG